jgi:nicotinamidase-related amidase
MGYDLSLVQAPIEPIARTLSRLRTLGFHIIHTREGHRPDLADLPANKRWRSRQIGAGGVGSATTAPAAASWCAASRGGRSFPRLRRWRARW